MKTQKDIETMLASATPNLKQDEAEVLWQRIESKIAKKAIPSPFFNMFTVGRMSVAALALILILGTGGTTVAAQQARPGDVLFPVERALEEVRLALAVNDTSRAALQLEFAEERLAELRSLIEENPKDNISTIATEASNMIRYSGEADVFNDVTIVSVEINDQKSSFRTDVKTREDVIKEIARRYNLAESVVDAGLDFETEDRASRVSDITHTNNDERVDESIKLLSSLVDDIDDNERKRFVNEILDTLDFDDDARVEVRNDGDEKRIEVRDGDERVRIREKDGEVRIDIKSDDDSEGEERDSDDERERDSDNDDEARDDSEEEDKEDDNDSNSNDESDEENDVEEDTEEKDSDNDDNGEERDSDDERERDSDNDDAARDDSEENVANSQSVNSIEVRVEDNEARVKIDYASEDDEFNLPYVSKATLISAISNKTGIPESVVEDELELEIKD